MVVASPGGDRHLRIPNDATIVDSAGNALAGGLSSPRLVEGAQLTITAERVENRPVVRSIRLGNQAASAPARIEGRPQQQDTSMLVPLTDLGAGVYQGYSGGLYPDGKNVRPAGHEHAGLALARNVQPLDSDGRPSLDGKIVLLGIGFSNTVQAFEGFKEVARNDPHVDPHVVLVNGAQGGMSAYNIQAPDDGATGTRYWAWVDTALENAGVTRKQVQAIWIKQTDPAPHEGGFPKYVETLEGELTRIVRLLPARFPNARLVYFSSRTYGGWAKSRPDG
ncbi:MAG TPA: hypothetical protein VG713_10270, partial [Pirellulales bacterium]|nr:hypothetical protein [Pirellulales bacterium]